MISYCFTRTKTTRLTNKWIEDISQIYDHIQKSIIQHLNYKDTIQYQLPISRKRGGLGLRNPRNYYIATKISSLSGKVNEIKKYFCFELLENNRMNINIDPEILKYNQSLIRSQQRYNQYINELIDKFNGWIGPNLRYIKQEIQPKHKYLLEMIDKMYLGKFYEIADDEDKARIKSISSNGASSWIDAVPNNI